MGVVEIEPSNSECDVLREAADEHLAATVRSDERSWVLAPAPDHNRVERIGELQALTRDLTTAAALLMAAEDQALTTNDLGCVASVLEAEERALLNLVEWGRSEPEDRVHNGRELVACQALLARVRGALR